MAALLFSFILSLAAQASCPEGLQKTTPESGQLQSGSCRSLHKFSFNKIKIPATNLSENKFLASEFSNVKVVGTNFSKSEFSISSVTNLISDVANFSKTTWRGSTIEDSVLKNTNFSESQWFGSRILRTQLNETSFYRAFARNCYLQEVSLEGADLRGADFETCLFLKVSLRDALYNKETKLPLPNAEIQNQGMIYKP